MTSQESFSEICRRVCDGQSWRLEPSGVHVPLAKGRHQVVALEVFEHENEELVRLTTTIGDTRELTPVRLTIALRINFELAHGAFAVKDENLILVDTLMLEGVGPDELELSIRYLAETADYYEKAIFDTDEY
jgi:hypothetical protein